MMAETQQQSNDGITETFPLLNLPEELLIEVLSRLSARDLVRVGTVSKALLEFTHERTLDRRLWYKKLPSFCIDAYIHESITREVATGAVCRPPLQFPASFRALSCMVHAFTPQLDGISSADSAIEKAIPHWDAVRLLHADVLLALACSKWPSLRTFAAYSSFLFHERCDLTRTAHLLERAAGWIEDEHVLESLQAVAPPWRAGIGEVNAPVHEHQAQARQLACITAMILSIDRYDYDSLQRALEQKRSVLRLGKPPPVFQEWLQQLRSCGVADSGAAPADGVAAESSGRAQADNAGAHTTSPAPGARAHEACLSFLGSSYAVADLARARRRLLSEAHPLREQPDKEVLAAALKAEHLKGSVAAMLDSLIWGMTTQFKDMYAWFMWQDQARRHVSDSLHTLAPPFICKRLAAWAAVDCYLTAVALLKAKDANNFKVLHVVGASSLMTLSDNMQTACLAEIALELHQLGWVDAAKHSCVWALVENEAGMCQDVARCRFELSGNLVDILSQALERARSAGAASIAATVEDALVWMLASAKLTPNGHAKTVTFVRRLSKVLHCCVLRLPLPRQRERCAKAALALCRLGLKVYRGKYAQKVDVLPVPLVDFSSLLERRQDLAPPAAGAPSTPVQPFALLAAWHQGDQRASAELLEALHKDDLQNILHPDGPRSSLSAQLPMGLSSVFARLFPARASSQGPPKGGLQGRAFPELCDWMGELLYVEEECALDATWDEYEEELAEILGLEDGARSFAAFMIPQDQDHPSVHWESICHIYEHMAHICTAMSRTSLSALFYGMCARCIMNIPPYFELREADVLGPDVGSAPTACKFLADILIQQATELTAACELPAAMRTLVFCEMVCNQHMQQATRRRDEQGEPQATQAMLARVKSQMGSIVMELHNRHGVSQLVVPEMRGSLGHYGSVVKPTTMTIPISYDAARDHVLQALEFSRHNHMDGHLQALFILGDVALVTYDLPEAQRLFHVVAKGASHSQVQHFNLMLQAHAFRAVTEMHMGDSKASQRLIQCCMTMFGLDVTNLAVYDHEENPGLNFFADAVRRLHEQNARPPAVPSPRCLEASVSPSAAPVPADTAAAPGAIDAAGERLSGGECGSSAMTALQAPSLSAAEDAQVKSGADQAGPSKRQGPQDAGASPGPSTRPKRKKKKKQHPEEQFTLEFETLTRQQADALGQDDLLVRLMAAAWQHQVHPTTALDSIMSRAWQHQMLEAPEGREEEYVERLRQAWLEAHPVEPFMRALREMVLQLPQVPTAASAQTWAARNYQGHFAIMLEELGVDQLPIDPEQEGWEEVPEGQIPGAIETGSVSASPRTDEDASDGSASDADSDADPLWDFFQSAEAPGADAVAKAPPDQFAIDFPDAVPLRPPPADGAVRDAWSSDSAPATAALRTPPQGFPISDDMLECGDAEWSAIEGFMNQVGLQIHLMHGHPDRASAEAVRSMTIKAHDPHSHVHIWYWSGAIAQHQRQWAFAKLLFRRAARCTTTHLHLSMRAKALTAACEVVLGYFTHTHFPALLSARFAALRSPTESDSRRYLTLHADLCREMKQTLDALPTGQGGGGEKSAESSSGAMLWSREEPELRAALCQSLRNAFCTSDNGVELRTWLVVQFVLKMDGTLRYSADGELLGGGQAVAWLPDAPTVAFIERRVSALLARLQRNVLVIRRLMLCNVVFDPHAVWQLAGEAHRRGRQFEELGI